MEVVNPTERTHAVTLAVLAHLNRRERKAQQHAAQWIAWIVFPRDAFAAWRDNDPAMLN